MPEPSARPSPPARPRTPNTNVGSSPIDTMDAAECSAGEVIGENDEELAPGTCSMFSGAVLLARLKSGLVRLMDRACRQTHTVGAVSIYARMSDWHLGVRLLRRNQIHAPRCGGAAKQTT